MMVPQVPWLTFCAQLDKARTIGCARCFSVNAHHAVCCPSTSVAIICTSLPAAVEYCTAASKRMFGKLSLSSCGH